jgi:hypothetical protein
MDAKIQQLMHQLKNSKVKIEADFEASLAAKDLEVQSMKLKLATFESN